MPGQPKLCKVNYPIGSYVNLSIISIAVMAFASDEIIAFVISHAF